MKANFPLLFLFLIFVSYGQVNAKKCTFEYDKISQDTLIVKHKNSIDQPYEVGLYSKSYSYFWIVGKDTLDFEISAQEYRRDQSMSIYIFHKNPLELKTAIKNIENCLPLIKQDFNTNQLNYIYFAKSFIDYPDIITELSNDYKAKFGKKLVKDEVLNKFLLNSIFSSKIDEFLKPLNRKVTNYEIEKLNLISKETIKYRLPSYNLANYPDFSLDGIGISLVLDKKQTKMFE